MIGKIIIAVACFFVYLLITMKLTDLMSSKTDLYWLGAIGILLGGFLYYKLLSYLFNSKTNKK